MNSTLQRTYSAGGSDVAAEMNSTEGYKWTKSFLEERGAEKIGHLMDKGELRNFGLQHGYLQDSLDNDIERIKKDKEAERIEGESNAVAEGNVVEDSDIAAELSIAEMLRSLAVVARHNEAEFEDEGSSSYDSMEDSWETKPSMVKQTEPKPKPAENRPHPPACPVLEGNRRKKIKVKKFRSKRGAVAWMEPPQP